MTQDEWQLAEDFLAHLRNERNLSVHTVKAYRRDLECLREYCEQSELEHWTDLRVHNLRRYAAQSFAGGLNPRSIQRRLSGARSFMDYLVREGIRKSNPVVEVSAPQGPKRLPETLDPEQMARLLEVRGDDVVDVRDRAIMELLYSSGLRLAELVGLNLGDIAEDGTVRVTGKGSKERIVPVGRFALNAVAEWHKQRAALAAQDEAAMFVGRRGRRISPRTIQAMVRRRATEAGLPKRVYPHLFRHSFATHVLSRPETSVACRKCWAMPTSAQLRSTRTLIFSI